MEVRAKYVTTIIVALKYEDAKGKPSGFLQVRTQYEYPRKSGCETKLISKTSVLQPGGQTK